jgi:hypothetical protein
VPMTYSDDKQVTYEANVIIDLNDETRKAFLLVSKDPASAQNLFKNDVDCKLRFERKNKVMSDSEAILHRIANHMDQLNVHNSTSEQIRMFCTPVL